MSGGTSEASAGQSRLSRLLSFLDQDPANRQLIADAAEAAFDEGEAQTALRLLERYSAEAPLPPALVNLRGLAAMRAGRLDDAAEAFESLADVGGPQVRFNLAWVRTLAGEHEAALSLLDEEAIDAAPRAAALKVRALHHLGRLEEALAVGQGLAERFPEDRELMGALASIAIDSEEAELAAYYAAQAGDSDEALAARGVLSLDEDRLEESLGLFSQALRSNPDNARANIGLGAGLMAGGDPAAALPYLERGAEIFRDHPGSWIAAGWAHFLAGDHAASRERFERALACDENFAESHGALAVVDLAEGKGESARRRTEIALRLDRNCFSAALARTMMLEAEGKGAAAEAIRKAALSTPVGPGGKTIAAAMAAFGATARRR
jgi:tetratricopeptide (TPR) repeat protein